MWKWTHFGYPTDDQLLIFLLFQKHHNRLYSFNLFLIGGPGFRSLCICKHPSHKQTKEDLTGRGFGRYARTLQLSNIFC